MIGGSTARRGSPRLLRLWLLLAGLAAVVLACGFAALPAALGAELVPEAVTFDGPDHVRLTGYLFHPPGAARRGPAIVLMHGRAGAYSSLADGVYDATTLSKRHLFWGRLWASQGTLALLVDGFGPRGYPHGFPAHSYDDRPDAVNEVTVRPRDAYAAFDYLAQRPDVDATRIGLQGWSNGGSATLATMAEATLAAVGRASGDRFRGALAFYPACGLHDRFTDGYKPYAPVRVFSGLDDEEVSAERCARLVEASRLSGGTIDIALYPGATHDFDDPGARRQRVPANAAAADDAVRRALTFMAAMLKPPPHGAL